ncbi:MAG: hypothetical protein WEA61_10405 [Anaerolineales bacterium]
MPSPEDRLKILDRVEKGEITPEEAARLLTEDEAKSSKVDRPMDVLGQLERGEISADEAARRLSKNSSASLRSQKKESLPPVVEVTDKDRSSPARTWGWWLIPVTIGALLTVLAALWMGADARDGGLGLGFFCAWFPLSLGILFILLGWLSRRGPWAHLRVDSRKRSGRVNFKLDLPVPVGVATTTLRTVGRHTPGLDEEDVDKLVQAMQEAGTKGEPISIRANDEDDDDVVAITIS